MAALAEPSLGFAAPPGIRRPSSQGERHRHRHGDPRRQLIVLSRANRQTRARIAVTALTLAVVVSGCAGTGSAKTTSGDGKDSAAATDLTAKLPQAIQDSGTIKVASNVEYPPFEYYDEDNSTIIGLDKDIADALSAKLGVTLEFNNMGFDAIIPALEAKRFDMAMSAMTDNEERRLKVDFVDYFSSGAGFLVPKGNPDGVVALEDICGLSVAVDKGTTNVADAQAQSEKCVADGQKAPSVEIYPGTSKIVLALENGRADLAMIDTSSAAYIAEQSGDKFEVPGAPYNPRHYGIVLPKGSGQLAEALQAALEEMLADGSYLEILQKWGQESGAVDEITINDGEGLS
jgi:polar amino acid transport system substrate-binding protein